MTACKAEFRERSFSARDGLELYFRDYGDPLSPGVAMLCLGGLTRNSKDFHPLARRLSKRRRVLCPDYRGRDGDQINAVMSAVGYNLRLILKWLRKLLRQIITAI